MTVGPFQVIGLFSLAGLAGTVAITQRRGWAATRVLWIKFAWYLLIVNSMLAWFVYLPDRSWIAAAAIVLTGLVELVCLHLVSPARSFAPTVIGWALYAVLAASFVFFTLATDNRFLVAVYAQVVVFDGFSQIAGQLAGRHKLAPSISPNKTVEGFAGGLIMAVVTAALLRHSAGMGIAAAILAGVVTGFAALAGDLLAARYKRLHGVKDYSRLIPAHGGMLDRFNGFIAAGAVWAVAGWPHGSRAGETLLRSGTWGDLAGMGIIAAGFFGILRAAERLRRKLPADTEVSRKVVHLATGLLVVMIPLLIRSHWMLLILCTVLGFLLEITRQAGLLPAVHAVDRTTAGCFCYPLAIYLCFVLAVTEGSLLFYFLPMLVLVVADTMAAMVGRRATRGRYRIFGANKSAAGVAAFFISATLVSVAVMWWWSPSTTWTGSTWSRVLTIAAAGALTEGASGGGWDNITVPLSVVAVLILTRT